MANKDNIKKHIFDSLDKILEQRKTANPDESYTAKLFSEGVDSILKKVSEEATETIVASKCSDNAAMIAWVGIEKFKLGLLNKLDFPARARWPLDEKAPFLKGAGIKF